MAVVSLATVATLFAIAWQAGGAVAVLVLFLWLAVGGEWG